MFKNKTYSILAKVEQRYLFTGILWLMIGLLFAIPGKSLERSLINMIVSVLNLVAIYISQFVKFEADDEMSIAHLQKAKSETMDLFAVICTVIGSVVLIIALGILPSSIIEVCLNINIIKGLPFVLLGICYILIGYYFYKFESEGE